VATFPQWETDLLKALGAPPSQANLTALNLWAQSEGSVTNNPLATSGRGAGATKCVAQCGSSSPIYEYDTEANGVAQMSQFLKGGYYTAIVRAFQQDAGMAAIYQAINNSPWCKGCQSGHYPVDLSQAVGGGGPSTSPTVGTGGTSNPGSAAGSSSNPGSGLSACVFQAPGFLFFSGPCFLTKGGVKWLSGAAAMLAGTTLGVFGVVLLASTVGKSTGATAAVKGAAKKVGIGGALLAGQPEVAAGLKATGGKSKSLLAAGQEAGARDIRRAQARQDRATAATAGREERYRISQRNFLEEADKGPPPGQVAREAKKVARARRPVKPFSSETPSSGPPSELSRELLKKK